MTRSDGANGEASQRIDKWLWCARFAKTRTLAGKLAGGGGMRLTRGGVTARIEKPSQQVRPGDVLTFMIGERLVEVELEALGARRGPASEARALYTDRSPPPAPKPPRAAEDAGRRPTKKERRAILNLKSSATE